MVWEEWDRIILPMPVEKQNRWLVQSRLRTTRNSQHSRIHLEEYGHHLERHQAVVDQQEEAAPEAEEEVDQ